MTAMQQMGVLLMIGGLFQLWLFVCRPEQYERERDRRDRNIKSVANAAAMVVKFFTKR